MTDTHPRTHQALGRYAHDPRIEPNEWGYDVIRGGVYRLVAEHGVWKLYLGKSVVAVNPVVELLLYEFLGEPVEA